tara:strand:+ start:1630 stop:2184 length:555 start_codon:yes stop_codon:yes gene_type:complete
MDSHKFNYNEEVIKGGMLLGGVSILLTMTVYLINIELMVEWWFGILNLLISLILVIYLGINYRNINNGFISFGNAFKFSFLILIISYLVGIIFQILLYNIIDPSLPEVIKQLTVEMTVEMMESFGTPDEAIDAAIVGIEQGIEEGTTPLGILKSTPWGTLFIAIFAAIASLIIKKNKPVSDRIN